MSNCENCNFMVKTVDPRNPNAVNMACHESPPQAVVVMVQGTLANQMAQQIIAVFPPVPPNGFCSRWEEREGAFQFAAPPG